MNRASCLLTFCFFCSCCAWAQSSRAVKTLYKESLRAAAQPATENTTRQLARQTIPQLALPAHETGPALRALEHNWNRSVFKVQRTMLFNRKKIVSSGFAFEEEYNGKTYLWGILSQHVTNKAGSNPHITFEIPGTPISYTLPVVAHGSQNFADMALVRLPDEIRQHIVPLKLAETSPDLNETAESFGYYEGIFGHTPLQTVKVVSDGRVLTFFGNTSTHVGACGGPMLVNGLVVGVFCGRSVKNEIHYTTNILQTKNLLHAARNKGVALKELKINGVRIGDINIDQSISKIDVYNHDRLLSSADTRKREHLVDYEHLERVIPLQNATDVYIELTRDNFLTTRTRQKDLALTKTILHYNLQTGDSRPLSYTRKLLYTYFDVLAQ